MNDSMNGSPQETGVSGLYCLGDASTSGFELTPVAIAAGRRLADRIFGGAANAKFEYANIATADPLASRDGGRGPALATRPPLPRAGGVFAPDDRDDRADRAAGVRQLQTPLSGLWPGLGLG